MSFSGGVSIEMRDGIFVAGPAAESASCPLDGERSLGGLCVGVALQAERLGDGDDRSVAGSALDLEAVPVIFDVMAFSIVVKLVRLGNLLFEDTRRLIRSVERASVT
jgi:hypothetical protein